MVVADTTLSPARYRLLEIVRAYCPKHDPDPAASRAAHSAWVRALVEHQARHLGREHSLHAVRTLNRELANLRAAMRYDLEDAPAQALRTAGWLAWFWHRRGHAGFAAPLLRAALDAAPDAPVADRARVLLCLATLFTQTGDRAAVWPAHRAAVELLTPATDRESRLLLAQAAYYAALFLTSEGSFDAAVASARDSVDRARAIGEDWFVPAASVALGAALAGAGQVAQGRAVLVGAAGDAAALKQDWTVALSGLHQARSLLIGEAEPRRALEVLRPALACFTAEDDVTNTLAGLRIGALALALEGRPREAALLLSGIDRCARRRGLGPVEPGLSPDLDAALSGVDRAEAAGAGDRLDERQLRALLDPR
ncbi:hypothetical protein Acy02nite_88940 [Actinoplanes cyaneus]|uniref:Uncharacterized protein n=1 Tax=Actinoplanes cyaneus TaxID=52696 RepID=A0A919IT99_9ACTN|nr:hypothetical protein Acy02nite_88940 [Actinoplanes cyaneus]